MEKVRIGVICPSEIAFRRFLPAIQKRAATERLLVTEVVLRAPRETERDAVQPHAADLPAPDDLPHGADLVVEDKHIVLVDRKML